MNLRERAELAAKQLMGKRGFVTSDIDCIERHLREAVEEAVIADRTPPMKIYGGVAVGITEDVIQPTAADALKAVRLLAAHVAFAEQDSTVRRVGLGCRDLIEGHRDTNAAKAIIGEGNEGGAK